MILSISEQSDEKLKTYPTHVEYFLKHRGQIRLRAEMLVKNIDMNAEDMLQQAFILFARQTSRNTQVINERHAFYRLTKIMRGIKRDYIKKRREVTLQNYDDMNAQSQGLSPLDHLIIVDAMAKIRKNFNILSGEEKALFMKRFHDGKSWEQLSRQYDLPLTTLRSRFVRILKKLSYGIANER